MKPAVLALGLVLCTLLPEVARGDTGSVIFEGNVVMPDEVYVHILEQKGFDPRSPYQNHEGRVHDIVKAVCDFLHSSGYELATCGARMEGGQIIIDIDEGRLTKIVFKGRGAVRSVQLQLALRLPHQVYNRPLLRRQLERLSERYGVPDVTYELVALDEKSHIGPQVSRIPGLEGLPLVREAGRYELHIWLGKDTWDDGFDLRLNVTSSDGVVVGASFAGSDTVFYDDRWKMTADVGGKNYGNIDTDDSSFRPSRAVYDLRWYTPKLFGTQLRPFLWGYTDLMRRQRRDLRVDRYFWWRTAGLINLNFEWKPGINTSLGGGVEYQNVLNLNQLDPLGAVPPLTDFDRVRGLWSLQGNFDFDVNRIRKDRRHELRLEYRHFFPAPALYALYGRYRNVVGFGWHDLIYGARGHALFGGEIFPDEEPVSNYTRGVFSERYYVSRAGGVDLEFRFSLSKDLIKVSIYTDLAVFEDRGVARSDRTWRFGSSHGLGFHALLVDVVQLDLYYGIGYASDGTVASGPSLRVRQAF